MKTSTKKVNAVFDEYLGRQWRRLKKVDLWYRKFHKALVKAVESKSE